MQCVSLAYYFLKLEIYNMNESILHFWQSVASVSIGIIVTLIGFWVGVGKKIITKEEKNKDKNDKKTIYAYSLTTEKFEKYLSIDEDMIKDSDGNKTFAPSGIAIHPITSEIFVISSQGKKL